jgi:hypothetical protein
LFALALVSLTPAFAAAGSADEVKAMIIPDNDCCRSGDWANIS